MKTLVLPTRFWIDRLSICLLALVVCTCVSLKAQVFQRFNEDNGLPINLVSDIIQDDYGLIWIATEAGLVRFDGSKTTVYRHDSSESSSISNDSPVKLAKADNGDIWIASHEGLLDRYRYKSDQFEHHRLSETAAVADNRVYSIHIDSGVVWLGNGFGLVQYDLQSHIDKRYSLSDITPNLEPNHNTVYKILPDPVNNRLLWLMTDQGLVKLDKSTMQGMSHQIDEEQVNQLPNLTAGYCDEKKIWVGSSRYGLRCYHPQLDEWEVFPDKKLKDPAMFNGISAIIPSAQNKLWIASWTRGFGLFHMDSETYKYFEHDAGNAYSVQDGEVNTLFLDSNDNLWIGGNQGVSFYNPSFQQFNIIELPQRTITHDKTNNFPSTALQINDSSILIGTISGNGLYIAKPDAQSCKLIRKFNGADYHTIEKQAIANRLHSLNVFDFLQVSSSKIWVSMYHQLGYYDVKQETLIFPKNTSNSFFKNKVIDKLILDHEGYMWGLNQSDDIIFKWDQESGEILQTLNVEQLFSAEYEDAHNYGLWGFAIDPDGNLWVHSFQDIAIYDPVKKQSKVLPRKEEDVSGLQGKGFYNIDIDRRGIAYLAASFNGLQIVRLHEPDENDRYKLVTMEDGLPTNKVIKVKCLGDDVWLTTRNGLVKYSPSGNQMRLFDKSNGIPDADLLNYWTPSLDAEPNGRIFFGNPDKLIWFQSDSLYNNERPPKIFISELKPTSGQLKSNRNLQRISEVQLTSDQNFFSVHFGMDDFTQPQKQKYRYRLVGYDDDWVIADKSRTANYTKVPGGKYTLEIEGANSSGTWSTAPARASIHIAIPFLQSQFFYFLVAGILLLCIHLIYRYRIRQIREKDQIRSDFNLKLAEVEMQALRAQMNPHFVFNSLNSINKFILTNDSRTASRYLTKFSKLMRLVLNNSSSKEISLQDELDALNLYVEMEQLRSSQGFEYSCNLQLGSNPISILVPPMIIQPFVENAIWHGLMPLERKGNLSLYITENEGLLNYVIEDDGIGRQRAMEIKSNKGVKRKSKGMQIISDRIKMSNRPGEEISNIAIEDKVDNHGNPAGTKVCITLKYNQLNSLNRDYLTEEK